MRASAPAELNLGTPGNANFAHIQGEQLMKLGGIKLVHVPFKGEAEVLRDLIAGHVQLTFAAAVAPQVAAGQVKVVATTCPRRSVTFPDVPSIVEAGYPDLAGEGWQGFAAPAGLPPAVLETLASAIRAAAADAAVVQRMGGAGLSVDYVGSGGVPRIRRPRHRALEAAHHRVQHQDGLIGTMPAAAASPAP
jgi:tripartite-type tricarboxylate transporter receptor subunit TctC